MQATTPTTRSSTTTMNSLLAAMLSRTVSSMLRRQPQEKPRRTSGSEHPAYCRDRPYQDDPRRREPHRVQRSETHEGRDRGGDPFDGLAGGRHLLDVHPGAQVVPAPGALLRLV